MPKLTRSIAKRETALKQQEKAPARAQETIDEQVAIKLKSERASIVSQKANNLSHRSSGEERHSPIVCQDRANYSDDHDLFIGRYYSHCDAALVGGNNVASAHISGCIKFQTKKIQAVTDPRTHFRSVFSDAAGEDDRIQAAESRGQRTKILFGLVTEQVDGVAGAGIGGARG